jgi:uncharacterized protein YndB with AHSA1/START domain
MTRSVPAYILAALGALAATAPAQDTPSAPPTIAHLSEALPMSTPTMPKRSAEIVSHINAPPDAVWRALTDADALIQWFPLEARVKPGVGGTIFTSWKNENQWESPIAIWEPNRRLRVLWCPAETPESELFGVDYFLHAQEDGTTVLRLVHFGFAEGPPWDEMYDGVSRGWDHMVWQLRNYLERHRTERRSNIYVGATIDEKDRDEVWARFFSRDGLFPDPSLPRAEPGRPFSLRLSTGDQATGVVRRLVPGKDFSAKIDSLGDAILNVQIHRCHGGPGFKLQVSLSSFGLDTTRAEQMTWAWQDAVNRAARVK